MTSTSLVAVVAVLLSPIIHAQGIYEEIFRGVDEGQIVFREFCDGETLPESITREALCDTLVLLHNQDNAAFLGVPVKNVDCTRALKAKEPFTTQQQLNEWCGNYCGTCQITI